jgi:hypothetical protein
MQMPSNVLRVVVFKEAPIGLDEPLLWVAQAIDVDMATQGGKNDDPIAVVAALGTMFDAEDNIRKQIPDAAPFPQAPKYYAKLFNAGDALGEFPLGIARKAWVRIGFP